MSEWRKPCLCLCAQLIVFRRRDLSKWLLSTLCSFHHRCERNWRRRRRWHWLRYSALLFLKRRLQLKLLFMIVKNATQSNGVGSLVIRLFKKSSKVSVLTDRPVHMALLFLSQQLCLWLPCNLHPNWSIKAGQYVNTCFALQKLWVKGKVNLPLIDRLPAKGSLNWNVMQMLRFRQTDSLGRLKKPQGQLARHCVPE